MLQGGKCMQLIIKDKKTGVQQLLDGSFYDLLAKIESDDYLIGDFSFFIMSSNSTFLMFFDENVEISSIRKYVKEKNTGKIELVTSIKEVIERLKTGNWLLGFEYFISKDKYLSKIETFLVKGYSF